MKNFLILCLIIALTQATQAKSNYTYSLEDGKSGSSQLTSKKLDETSKVLFVVDFSGSMKDRIGNRRKIDIALETLSTILPQVPQNQEIGLRVYGHRNGFTYYDSCKASKLAVPFARNNSYQIMDALNSINPVGSTPITYSLKQAIEKDFKCISGEKHIILLTDGGENCDESPCTFVIDLISKRDDIKIDVIAYDVYDSDARNQLKCTALTTSGKYYKANSQEELQRSLFDSLKIDKDVKGVIKITPN